MRTQPLTSPRPGMFVAVNNGRYPVCGRVVAVRDDGYDYVRASDGLYVQVRGAASFLARTGSAFLTPVTEEILSVTPREALFHYLDGSPGVAGIIAPDGGGVIGEAAFLPLLLRFLEREGLLEEFEAFAKKEAPVVGQ